jgi:cytochrome c
LAYGNGRPYRARCHALTADGPSRSGPHFANLFGRKVGSVSGYHYSDALKSADFEWNDETLFRLFDIGPDKMLPGTKMPVQRVTDDAQLTALVDYLKVLTGKAQE